MLRHSRPGAYLSTIRATRRFLSRRKFWVFSDRCLRSPTVPQRPQELADLAANCRAEYVRLAVANSRLRQYVSDANASLARHPGAFLTANLQEVVYYLLSLPPFDGWSADPARRVRLARITALVESFASMPVSGHPNASRGR